jgi:murein tripeptide amidase MpaA
MKRTPRRLVSVLAVIVLLGGLAAGSASAAPAETQPAGDDQLEAYTAVVEADQLPTIAEQGIDVSAQRRVENGVELDMVLDENQADRLRGRGVDLKLTRVHGGLTVQQFAAEQAANGFTVWRSYDEPGGIRDQLYAAARSNPQLVKLEVLGHTAQGREIIAVKMTQGAGEVPDGARPAVLYSSTQHAREWISTEVNRRLMNHFIDRWRANDRSVRKLLQTTELWFVLVANPDGYQYTFDHERLWRKNLRDNNGDGQTQVGDGVDPNRNFPNHWG